MQRLDLFLSATRKDFSRNLYQKFIKEHGVFINGLLIKKTHALVGEKDKVDFDEIAFKKFIKSFSADITKISINKCDILFEDKSFLVIDKPPFVRTEGVGKGLFLVHRLDKDTSGILILAKDVPTQTFFQNQWQSRSVKKTYVTLIKGTLPNKTGSIDAPINRSFKDRRKMAVSSSIGSRESVTEFSVKKVFGNEASLVEAYPKTGRTHQIRVHFSSIGHPVVGDSVYGDKKLNKKFEQLYGLKRQFLHAQSLELVVPNSKKKKVFKSKLPKDLSSVLGLIEKQY
jgi:23S rRNA pseudouridine1911/1915/1917 synthase